MNIEQEENKFNSLGEDIGIRVRFGSVVSYYAHIYYITESIFRSGDLQLNTY